jgi:muconolactone delta-isomerase
MERAGSSVLAIAKAASGVKANGIAVMLFLVVSTPRPERPSELTKTRQSFWPWIGAYQARGVCRHIYARAGRGAVAVLDVADNDALHRILNEWANIVPAHFDTYPLIDAQAAQRMLAAQQAMKSE